MVLGLKGEGGLFAEDLDDLVVLLAAGDDVLGRQVRQGRDEGLDLLLEVALLLVHALDALAHLLHLGHERGHVAAFLLDAGDLLVDAVALGLHGLVLRDELAAARIPGEQLGKVHLVLALGQLRLDVVGVLADQVDVQHVHFPPIPCGFWVFTKTKRPVPVSGRAGIARVATRVDGPAKLRALPPCLLAL